jgi:hypothetical protein
MSSFVDLTGKRFGRLEVLGRAPTKNKRTRWNVRCDCGTQKVVGAQNLMTRHASRRVVSCGCYHREICYRENAACRDAAHLMLWGAKKRAREDGVPFGITVADIEIPECCPLLGIALERAQGFRTGASPSLDRIRPELGYVPGNVWVISFRANQIKSDATLDELRAIVRGLEVRCGS